MPAWLPGKSSSREVAPQSFELVCECGVRHTGMRRSTAQEIVCRFCQKSLFVLPRNVYPAASVTPESLRPRLEPLDSDDRHEDDDLPIDQIIDDLDLPEEPDPEPRVSRHRRRRQEQQLPRNDPAFDSDAATATLPESKVATSAPSPPAIRSEGKTGRSRLSSLQKTGLAVVILLVGLGFWTAHAARVEKAAREVNPAVEAGLKALEAGDLRLAALELTKAVEALDLLGRRDEYSLGIRQTCREAVALDGLPAESLLDILEEADAFVRQQYDERNWTGEATDRSRPAADAGWVRQFDARYGRRTWLVLELMVRRAEATDQRRHPFTAELPVAIGPRERRVEIRTDFATLEPVIEGARPAVVTIGGRLQSLRLSPDEQLWIVTLDPESGFLWTGYETYRHLGFPMNEFHTEEQVRSQLARQARLAGVTP